MARPAADGFRWAIRALRNSIVFGGAFVSLHGRCSNSSGVNSLGERGRTQPMCCAGDGKARDGFHHRPRFDFIFQKQACPLVASRRGKSSLGSAYWRNTQVWGLFQVVRAGGGDFRSLSVLSLSLQRVVLRRRDASVLVPRYRDGPSDLSPGLRAGLRAEIRGEGRHS
jgi:hypothetical protein